MEPNKEIHKYFRLGDIVINYDIWEKQLFVIRGFGGNDYYPELYVYEYGKSMTINHFCNFCVRETKLIDSPKRPFKKFKKYQLLKLMNLGNKKTKEEIKREIIIRTNRKSYGFI